MILQLSPWRWIPTLYYAQGVPNAIITFAAQVLFLALGMNLVELTFWTGLLGLPWALKFLWAPLLDSFLTKKQWIVYTQLIIGLGFALLAFLLPFQLSTQGVLALFFLIGFISATCDIASDGFYIIGLNPTEQSFFSGIRNTFFRIANISIRGGLIMLAAYTEKTLHTTPTFAWSIALSIVAIFFVCISLYHAQVLIQDTAPKQLQSVKTICSQFKYAFKAFFEKKFIFSLLIFIFLYRFAEAQLGSLTTPFLLASHANGGLALTESELGLVYGACGVVFMLGGGILGGILIMRFGLGKMLWPMVFALNVPDLLYLILAYFQPSNFYLISSFVAIEQFGYGLGFASFMLILVYFADSSGTFRTTHYAFMSGLMIAATVLPSTYSGLIASHTGYPLFFTWVIICTIPSFFATYLISSKVDPLFGKKTN